MRCILWGFWVYLTLQLYTLLNSLTYSPSSRRSHPLSASSSRFLPNTRVFMKGLLWLHSYNWLHIIWIIYSYIKKRLKCCPNVFLLWTCYINRILFTIVLQKYKNKPRMVFIHKDCRTISLCLSPDSTLTITYHWDASTCFVCCLQPTCINVRSLSHIMQLVNR